MIENARLQYKKICNDNLETVQKIALEEELKETERKAEYLYSEQKEKYLDSGFGQCYLSNPKVAKMIANSLVYFDNVRYHLHAWCIMPNHVHVIVEPKPDHNLSDILHSWKSYTAHSANKILGLKGTFWQYDAYNHIIRSASEYHFQIRYVWNNPEKARLKNWQWRWKLNDEFSTG